MTGSGHAPDPFSDDGTLCGSDDSIRAGLSYLEGDRSVNSLRVSSLGHDLHEDRYRPSVPIVTGPSVECCRPIAPLSSLRRSVAFYDFKIVSQPVVYACQHPVSPTPLCSCFISETVGSVSAFTDLS